MFLTAFSLLALLIPFYCTDTINPILMGLCLIIPDPQHETPLLLVTREKKTSPKHTCSIFLLPSVSIGVSFLTLIHQTLR